MTVYLYRILYLIKDQLVQEEDQSIPFKFISALNEINDNLVNSG